ncbi:hypothetical protein PPL_03256 [Heterostelium album PN500]|uniref:Uncharacterized protein n=1 Tax=Heterostelium pallidum (strain ATCC 26659 / Pp 5 / PN500) TaxID=670386 RepID=D3B4D3_HETP5|nr:hypothetical protein PPL_03256 [Heterostelium album PN500]EFA84181.1 hypothetical protein PPL_03256 [Heterostelium album PN500]|eukprot:XP_020436298.1 hypothetical protein PPL_03256 [Heterostelium album PN500]
MNTAPIHNVLTNKYLFKKIILSLPTYSILPNNPQHLSLNAKVQQTGWRCRSYHYQKLSELLDVGYYSLILDRIKSGSISITNDCIRTLVKSSLISDQLFESIYQLKQWMFVNEDLLFCAVESGHLERVKLFAQQSYPVIQSRQTVKISIAHHAWQCLQFEIYNYLVKHVCKDNGEAMGDLSPGSKSKLLLDNISKLENFDYLYEILDASPNDNTLYPIKLLLLQSNRYKVSKELLVKVNGLQVIQKMFPPFEFSDQFIEHLFQSLECSEYHLKVLDKIAKGLPLDTMKKEIKQSLSESLETLKRFNIKLEQSVLDHQESFEFYVLLFKALVKTLTRYRPIFEMNVYQDFCIKLIKSSGLVGLPIVLGLGLSPSHQCNHFVKYGTLEQVKLAREISLSSYNYHFVKTWVIESFKNQDDNIFNIFVEQYGYDTIASQFDALSTQSLSISSLEKLTLCHRIDPSLQHINRDSSLNIRSMNTEYVNYLMTLSMQLGVASDSFLFNYLVDVTYYSDQIEHFKTIVTKEIGCNHLSALLDSAIKSLKYQYISYIISIDSKILEKSIETVALVGDIGVLQMIDHHLSSNNQLLSKLVYHLLVNGQFSLLEYCKEQYRDSTINISEHMTSIIQFGRLDIIKYYINHCQQEMETTTTLHEITKESITSGQLEIFKYLIENVVSIDRAQQIWRSMFTEQNLKSLLNSKFAIPMLTYAISHDATLELTERIIISAKKKSKYNLIDN